jgi:hypothetical protein
VLLRHSWRRLRRSMGATGQSWRVGVVHPDSASRQQKLQPKPAGMQIKILEDVQEDLQAFMVLQLFKAELLTGVLEVDSDGVIVKAGACPLYQPGVSPCVSTSPPGEGTRPLPTPHQWLVWLHPRICKLATAGVVVCVGEGVSASRCAVVQLVLLGGGMCGGGVHCSAGCEALCTPPRQGKVPSC